MKVLLVNPPIREWAKPNCFPEGLGILASCLKNAGHEVEAVDINAYRYSKEQVYEIIKKSNYDLVGMGGLITVYGYMVWFTQICNELHPDKPIILGGNAVTPIPQLILKHTKADIACINEGEKTIVEVANVLEKNQSLRGILGIWYREKDGTIIENPVRPAIEDLDTIPWADRKIFPTDIYVNNAVGATNRRKWIDGATEDTEEIKKSFIVRVSRGCPYRCTFCYHDFIGEKFRMRSPEKIVEEIEFIMERYGVTHFGLGDDLATANRNKFTEICRLSVDKKLNYTFGTSIRANLVKEEFLIMLKKSGCNAIFMGLESASPKILKIMNKQVTVQQQKDAFKLIKKHFDDFYASFIIGYPGETYETVQETIDFCKEMSIKPEVIFYATPYPGTWLYEEALRRNLIRDEHEYLLNINEQGERPAVNFTDWTDEELISIKENMARELDAMSKEFTANGKVTSKKTK